MSGAPRTQASTAPDPVSFELVTFKKRRGLLSKSITLMADGSIKSDGSACVMGSGTARRTVLTGMAGLAAHIANLGEDEALALGRLNDGIGDLVQVSTKAKLTAGTIARSKEFIGYRTGEPGVLLVDFDMKGMPTEVKHRLDQMGGVSAAISKIVDLSGIGTVIRASTSAGISCNDKKFPGSGGLHLYILIKDASDAERALKALHDQCWLAGLGWMLAGGAGQALERSIVDRLVFGPERLVFEGGPRLGPGISQDKQARRPIPTEGEPLDSLAAIRDLNPNERGEAARLKKADLERIRPEMARLRTAWIAERVDELVARGQTREAAQRTVERLADGGVLLPSFLLIFDDDELGTVSVGDVLADPDKFAGATLADPLEGTDYGRGKAYLGQRDDGALWIYSFAHGRTDYELKFDGAALAASVAELQGDDAVLTFIRNLKRSDTGPAEAGKIRAELRTRLGYGKREFDRIYKAHETAERILEANRQKFDDVAFDGDFPKKYRLTSTGLYGTTAEGEMVELSAALSIDGMASNAGDDERGIAISWVDSYGVRKNGLVPRDFTQRGFSETLRHLWQRGLDISTKKAAFELLTEFFLKVHPARRLEITDKPGWTRTEDGIAFALPGGDAAGRGASLVYPSIKLTKQEEIYKACGTLGDWQDLIASKVVGNHRFVLAIAAAFAGPVLRLLHRDSFIIHFHGHSRTGKTTGLRVAISVIGRAKEGDAFRSWDTTANAAEWIAASANDLVFGVDEINKAARGVPGRVVYAFASGAGKSRLQSDITPRNVATWIAIGLSTGEKSFAEKMLADGYPSNAGQEVRCISIPAEADAGMGIVEELNGYPNSAMMVEDLRTKAQQYYGTAIRHYLDCLIEDIERDKVALLAWFNQKIDAFVEATVGDVADSQARDVAANFGLIAAAGELAIRYGTVPWEPDAATDAATVCIAAWLRGRPAGLGQAEDEQIFRTVKEAVRTYQQSRWQDLVDFRAQPHARLGPATLPYGVDDRHRPRDHWGFREMTKAGDLYWTYPGALADICKTTPAGVKDVGAILHRKKVLVGQGKSNMRKLRLGRGQQPWMYCIRGSILDGEKEG